MKQALWIVVLVTIAYITGAAQIDRQSRYNPNAAAYVPTWASSFAQYHRASSAVAAGEAVLAENEARRLVAKRPMPAENLSLLAQAQFMAGNAKAAAITAHSAARRGWRDLPSQRAVLAASIESGDHDQAVRRYLAIWITQGSEHEITQIAPLIFQPPAAQRELERLLLEQGRWRGRFLRDGLPNLPLDQGAQILLNIRQNSGPVDCELLEQSWENLLKRHSSQSSQTSRAARWQPC